MGQLDRRVAVEDQVALGAANFAAAPEGPPLLVAAWRVVPVVKMLAAWLS